MHMFVMTYFCNRITSSHSVPKCRLLILFQILLNRSDLRIFEIDLVIFLNELGIFENELGIFVNERHLSNKCSITTNEKIKDPGQEMRTCN